MKNKNFFMAKNKIFDLGLKPRDLSVLLYLIRCENNSNGAFPSYKTIANKTGMSKSTAMRSIKFLKDLNIITKKVRKTTKEELKEKLEYLDEFDAEYHRVKNSNLNKSNVYSIIYDFDNDDKNKDMFHKIKAKYSSDE